MKHGDAQRWLAAIVESSDDAIIGKRLDGTIASWNASATRLYGYAAEEMVGQPMASLLSPDLMDEERTTVAKLVRGERTAPYETRRRRKDGVIVDVWVSVAPILDAGGSIIGASEVARDITEEKQERAAASDQGTSMQSRLAAAEQRVATAEQQLAECSSRSTALEESNQQLNRALAAARIAQQEAEAARRDAGRGSA